MNSSEVRAEPVASTKLTTFKLGLDVHADTIVVVRILDQSSPQPAQQFTPPKFLEWVKTQVGRADAVHSCYEAGPFGYGLHRQLVALGLHNVVVQPVCLDERHTGVNDDKRDARELALRLDRYVAGNTHALATVRARAPEKAGRWSGGSPLLCGEEPCGIEPELRRRKAGWRAPERERPVRNTDRPQGRSP